MRINSKSSIILLQTILLFFSIPAAFAQFPGMGQVRTNMSNQWMAQQMQMNMRMSMMNNFGNAGRSQNSSRIPGKFNEYTYLVKFKDGTTKTVKSYIYIDTTLHKSYLLFVDKSVPKSDTAHRKQKIYADKTSSIGRIFETTDANDSTQSVKQDFFIGLATDSCWLFKVLPGKITLYSFFSEKGSSGLFDPSTVVGIQFDDGPITRLDFDVLKSFIASDEKAMKYFTKKDYYSAIEKFDKDSEKNKKATSN
jgi:hypothetical protein